MRKLAIEKYGIGITIFLCSKRKENRLPYRYKI